MELINVQRDCSILNALSKTSFKTISKKKKLSDESDVLLPSKWWSSCTDKIQEQDTWCDTVKLDSTRRRPSDRYDQSPCWLEYDNFNVQREDDKANPLALEESRKSINRPRIMDSRRRPSHYCLGGNEWAASMGDLGRENAGQDCKTVPRKVVQPLKPSY